MLTTSFAFGQDKTKDEAIDLITEDTCECIRTDTESFSDDKSLSQKKMALGVCIIKSFNERKKESEELKNTNMNDFEAIGEEIGMRLVTVCGGDFLSIFSSDELMEMSDEDEENDFYEMAPPPASPKNENDLQLEASLVSLNNDAVSYINVKDAFSKSHVFLINEQFEGYELLKKSNFGKTFKIYYKEIDLFDLSENRYVKKKVIKYLELL